MFKHKDMIFVSLFLFVPACFVSAQTKSEQLPASSGTTVQYVTVVFRHGEHTGDAATAYPLDPYINETYYPYGVGQLTARGKERQFALGQALRKRYDTFLENVYSPDFLDPICTDMSRTKASLLLVLAALYPPKGNIMEWNSKLNWQPIPYKCLNFETDLWFTISIYFCSNYAKEYNSYLTKGDGVKLQQKYGRLYKFLQESTGLNIQRTMEIFFVHSGLQAQSEWGLTLPSWTENVWPEQITEATTEGLASSIATTKLKQLSGGPLLKRIIEKMKAKANGTLEPETRKMALYSGHDLNVAYALGAMNVPTSQLIPYGAYVLVELHKIGNAHFVKILYEDYSGNEPKILTVPGCEELCPLNKFESILKVNYPEKDNPCGDDTKVLEENQQQKDYYTGKLEYKSLIRRYLEWNLGLFGQVGKGVINFGKGAFNIAKSGVDKTSEAVFGKDKGIFNRFSKPFGL